MNQANNQNILSGHTNMISIKYHKFDYRTKIKTKLCLTEAKVVNALKD